MTHFSQAEISALVEVLINGLPGPALGPWLDGAVAALPAVYAATLPPSTVAPGPRLQQILGILNQAGPLDDGRLPLAVVLGSVALVPVAGVSQRAERLLTMLGGATAPGPAARVSLQDGFAQLRVAGAALFVDRDSLRTRIRGLAHPDGPPAIVINGDARAGKSHTRNLLVDAARRTSLFRVGWVEIQREQAASFTADWLVEDLVRTVQPGASGVPPRREPVARWLGDLVDWVFRELTATGTAVPVWLVIDGLRLPGVHPDVSAVVDGLARRAATPAASLRIRLILIDCDPTDIQRSGCIAEEETFAHLTTADAEAALRLLAPDRFAQLWPAMAAALQASQELTTPMIAAVLREALR